MLHHAWTLRRPSEAIEGARPAEQVQPVLVSRWNGWNRASIAYLYDAGLPRNALHYFEVTMLRDGPDGIAWFDEPFAAWRPCAVPPVTPQEHVHGELCWYEVPEAQTWIGTTNASAIRPLFALGPIVALATVDRGGHVAWIGANAHDPGTVLPTRLIGRRRADADVAPGRLR